MELINTYGRLASSIVAILGLLTLVLWKPIKSARARVLTDRKNNQEFQTTVLKKLDGLCDDVGDLQCDRLSQAHDHYVSKGVCPTEKKMLLCDMYTSYHAKGRNHLSEHYEKDIMELPDSPAKHCEHQKEAPSCKTCPLT